MGSMQRGVNTSEFWVMNFYALMGMISAKISPELMPMVENIGYIVMTYILGRVGVKLAPMIKIPK